jgi:hypothetical protein
MSWIDYKFTPQQRSQFRTCETCSWTWLSSSTDDRGCPSCNDETVTVARFDTVGVSGLSGAEKS